MKNITFIDMLLCSIIMALGTGVIVCAAVSIGVSNAMAKFGMILWLVACPLIYMKVKPPGKDNGEE